jgi:hypothetical protein
MGGGWENKKPVSYTSRPLLRASGVWSYIPTGGKLVRQPEMCYARSTIIFRRPSQEPRTGEREMDIFHRIHVIRELSEMDIASEPKLSDFQRSLLQLKSKLEADGLEHPGTLAIMMDLVILQYNAWNLDSAAELFFEVAATREILLGTEHLARGYDTSDDTT